VGENLVKFGYRFLWNLVEAEAQNTALHTSGTSPIEHFYFLIRFLIETNLFIIVLVLEPRGGIKNR